MTEGAIFTGNTCVEFWSLTKDSISDVAEIRLYLKYEVLFLRRWRKPIGVDNTARFLWTEQSYQFGS